MTSVGEQLGVVAAATSADLAAALPPGITAVVCLGVGCNAAVGTEDENLALGLLLVSVKHLMGRARLSRAQHDIATKLLRDIGVALDTVVIEGGAAS